jgi:CDP-diacylglycerol--glycerol-3-phosphate 3-phosphatidyltransferase
VSTRADHRASLALKAITYLRVVLTPVVMALILIDPDATVNRLVAAALFGIAAGTDYLDGRLARRWKQTTPLGTFLDTTADKLLVSGVLMALVEVGRTSAWIAFLIIGRELLVLGLKGVASAAEGNAVAPTMLGKWKATVQFVAIALAIWRPDIVIGPWFLDQWAMAVATVLTVWSGADYIGRYAGAFRSAR